MRINTSKRPTLVKGEVFTVPDYGRVTVPVVGGGFEDVQTTPGTYKVDKVDDTGFTSYPHTPRNRGKFSKFIDLGEK